MLQRGSGEVRQPSFSDLAQARVVPPEHELLRMKRAVDWGFVDETLAACYENHYGSRSRRGTQVAALFYSLLESAKLCGVEPKTYLLAATRAALATPGTVTLPHTLLSYYNIAGSTAGTQTPRCPNGLQRGVTND